MDIITGMIIKSAYKVLNTLGCGFLEKVYENALCLELREQGFEVYQQYPIKINYRNKIVGEYVADIIVNNEVIIELKVTSCITNIHMAQLLNYLNATKIKKGLILDFSKTRLQIKRMVNNY